MKIVIDIPEYIYKLCQGHGDPVYEYIGKGTPIPKGHGRLIDADEIQFENADFDTYGDYCRAFDAIDQADTIIEADAESEDKA